MIRYGAAVLWPDVIVRWQGNEISGQEGRPRTGYAAVQVRSEFRQFMQGHGKAGADAKRAVRRPGRPIFRRVRARQQGKTQPGRNGSLLRADETDCGEILQESLIQGGFFRARLCQCVQAVKGEGGQAGLKRRERGLGKMRVIERSPESEPGQ